MKQDYPGPPAELVEQWVAEIWHEGTPVRVAASDIHIAKQAALWGYMARQSDERVWFKKNPKETLSAGMMKIAYLALEELMAARDLAVSMGKDPDSISVPYLELMMKLGSEHEAMEQRREASADCQPND